MADTDRRGYGAAQEPPLTLGRRNSEPRGRSPAPVTLILSILVLVVAGAGVFWLYRSGSRGSGDAPQPVGAPLRDVRVAAPPQSEPPNPAAGLSIYKDTGAAPPPPTFAPAPEQPTPRPTEGVPAHPAAASAQTAAATTHPESATPAEAQHKTAAQSAGGDPLGALIDRSTRPEAKASAKPVKVADVTGGTEIQIGAFSSQAQADQGWSAAAAAAPGPLAGKGKKVVPLDHDGATLYRTFITGFASREAAEAACDRLKAAGRTCFVR
jgi:SPOR domain